MYQRRATPHRCRDIKATACSAALPHSLPRRPRRNGKKITLPPHPQRQNSISCMPSPPFPPRCCLGCASQPAGSGRVCVCVFGHVFCHSPPGNSALMKIERTPVLFFLALLSLSVPLSVSPVLSNEAVVQLCDGLFAIFFSLECGLQKWGCKEGGASKAPFFFVLFVCLKITH